MLEDQVTKIFPTEGVTYLETLNISFPEQHLPTYSDIQDVNRSRALRHHYPDQRQQRLASMITPSIGARFPRPEISERSHGSETTMHVGEVPSALQRSEAHITVLQDDMFALKIRGSPKDGGSIDKNSNFMRVPRISSPRMPSDSTHPTKIWDGICFRHSLKLTCSRDSETNHH
jgi:hypothetical protein